ncbi:betaine/choline/glycine transport protein [Klebsiella pneumoniae]|uniref:Betaine/choline/glycine transport protein n=1 Tax=Klebsiella pneumoniae TaxID=573 RepID=A0A447S581_KLEPN|nr:betaine/choline/glycine transport protein [Klebsiella pneumoniae]
MDAVAYTMAATSTRNLREGEDPDRGMRLFWCVVITLIPLSILFTGASLETMKNYRGADRPYRSWPFY